VVSDAAFLNPSLEYDRAGVYLTLRRNDVDFRATGTRGNQTAVASALNGLVRSAFGEMAGVINNVYDLSSAEAVKALRSMTGILHQHLALSSFAGSQSFIDVNMARLGQLANRERASERTPTIGGLPLTAPSEADRQGAWFSGIGGHTRFAGGNGDPAARVYDRGYAIGYDAEVGDHLIIGGSAGDTSPEVELAAVNDRSSSQMRHAGAYGRYTRNRSRLSVMGGGSHVSSNTDRWITDGVVSSSAHATYDGGTLFTRAEYGYTFSLGRNVNLEPQAGFQYARLDVDGFTENGAGVLNLVAPDRHVSSQRATLGGKAVRTFGRPGADPTTLEMRAAWAHEFNPLASVRLRFLGDNADNAFDLASPARIEDSAIIGATFAGEAFRHVKFLTSVNGDISSAIKLWTASIGVRAEW
jgi:outer membrane autotransporter protein